MFTISVCMIVKDEEDVIDRILSCVKKFADEIIIVDTGSKDKTIEIASKYTSYIFKYTWNDNFADARNFSFSKATKDYIMWLDADDYITDENTTQILHLKKQPCDVDVYMLKYIMGFKDNNHTLEYYRERIVKNTSEFQWVGFVHECITPKGNIKYLDICIEHRKVKQGDPKRNLKLYNKALKNGVAFSPREQYYYARELYYNGYYTSAEKAIKKYLKQNDQYIPNILGAHIILSNIYLITNNISKGRKIIFSYLEKHKPSSELLINLAKFYELDNKIDNAIFTYQSCVFCPRDLGGFVNPQTHEFIPYLELTRLYYKIGNYNLAKIYHNLAKKLNPDHPIVIYNEQFFN